MSDPAEKVSNKREVESLLNRVLDLYIAAERDLLAARSPSVDERQRAMEPALAELIVCHRGWCNYCGGDESVCMNVPEGGCSLRDYLRALSSAPKAR